MVIWCLGQFSTVVNAANTWVLDQFGWLFSACAFFSVMLCIAICCTAFWQSGFASVRIGGPDAKPLMSIWNWFSNNNLYDHCDWDFVLVHGGAD